MVVLLTDVVVIPATFRGLAYKMVATVPAADQPAKKVGAVLLLRRCVVAAPKIQDGLHALERRPIDNGLLRVLHHKPLVGVFAGSLDSCVSRAKQVRFRRM